MVSVVLLGCTASTNATDVTVYKSPTCGCCEAWVSHLQQDGFDVKVLDVKNVAPYKTQNGVTPKLASCHTAFVDGYVIEGHVPAQDIRRLLRERPKVTGLAVPGMPIGSPGMEQGGRKDPYQVLTFDKNGNTSIYANH